MYDVRTYSMSPPFPPSRPISLLQMGVCSAKPVREKAATAPERSPSRLAMDLRDPTYVFGKRSGSVTDKYVFGETLGGGQFGKARLVTSKATGEVLACKTLSKRKLTHPDDVEDVRREVKVMSHLAGHFHVVKIYDTFEDAKDCHIIMEICTGGELFERMLQEKKYTEKRAADMVRVIMETIDYMHQMGVIHRDLKPENFLLDSDDADANLKFTDFGLSVFFKPGDFFSDRVGSAYYMAPEVLGKLVMDPKTGKKVKVEPKYNQMADIWSCGVILYILLCGSPPFWGDTQEAIFKEVVRGELDLTSHPWPMISNEAKECVKRMLTRDFTKRATAAELLSDPWLKKNGCAPDRLIDNVVSSRLKEFAAMNKLKKRALQVIAANLAPQEIEGLKNMFEAIDTDKSGTITVNELKACVGKGHFKLSESDLSDLLKSADVDGSGGIEYEEFLAATMSRSKLEKEEYLYKAFLHFDTNKDGKLSVDEITAAIGGLGLGDGSQDEALAVIAECDKDGDGEVDYDEFIAMMRANPSNTLGGQQGPIRNKSAHFVDVEE